MIDLGKFNIVTTDTHYLNPKVIPNYKIYQEVFCGIVCKYTKQMLLLLYSAGGTTELKVLSKIRIHIGKYYMECIPSNLNKQLDEIEKIKLIGKIEDKL